VEALHDNINEHKIFAQGNLATPNPNS